jgi:hypothetical protein
MFIPAGGGPMPNYFAGTNCRASGAANIGQPISDAYLYLIGNDGETQVAEFHSDGSHYPLSIGLACMFDSSHYPNLSNILVKLKVYVPGNPVPFTILSTPVEIRNKVAISQHPDSGFSDAASVVYWEMWNKNYAESVLLGSWSNPSHFADIDGANAICYAGHGNPLVYTTGDLGAVTPGNHVDNRIIQLGSGTPPFNTGAPMINFFHIIACNCGDTPDFQYSLTPYWNAWGGVYMEDQALMAYSVYVSMSQVDQLALRVWSKLSQGKTAMTALVEFNLWLTSNPGTLKAWDVYNTKSDPSRDMLPGDMVLYYGDDNGSMRVKSVYTGTNVLPIGWFYQV